MSARILTHLIVLTLPLLPTAADAEVFVLANGGRINGQWLNPDAEPLIMYEIAMAGGGRLALSSAQVERVIVKSEELLRYEAELPKVPDTVDGHWEMAERCRKADLKPQREIHLRRILELVPDHSDARHALGFSRVNGQWVKPDQWLAKQGYIRHRGSWRLPQEIELEARRERQQLEESQWRKKLKRWRTSIARGRDDSREALEQLRTVNSGYAIAPLADMLNDKDEVKPLKLVFIEILGRFDNSNAAAALLERVMTDPDVEVRERAVTALQTHGRQQAVAMLTRTLKDKENKIVNQAAWALGKLGDPQAIPALIDAVVTTHKFPVQRGGGPGRINAGNGVLQMGGRPKIMEQDFQNPHVLGALTALIPGINFGYNEQAWKTWWAESQSPPGVNLRRNL